MQITTGHYFTDDTNPAVHNLMKRLSSAHVQQKNASILDEKVVGLGSCQRVQLTARQVLAVMQLTNGDVLNRSAVLYKRFVANNQLYTSADYERSKNHHNFDVHVQDSAFPYGAISGLYVVKPDCTCRRVDLQYCQCVEHNIVLVNIMQCIGESLYCDSECVARSGFLQEVVPDPKVFALYPSRTVMTKCIRMVSEGHIFLCKLPYRFHGD